MEDQFSIPIEYKMTEEETNAYQLALLWMQKVREYFPDVRLGPGNSLRKTGDPRKSSLFKWMMRMIRGTRKLVDPGDLKFYIIGNLWVCKNCNDEGECYVTPQMLSGGAAMRRWKLYEARLKKAKARRAGNSNPNEENVSMEMVRTDIDVSNTFLRRFVPEITPQFLTERYEKGDIAKWLHFGFIRPYFVALSPTLKALGIKIPSLSGLSKQEVIDVYRVACPKDHLPAEDVE